jgi:CheY-like chemotaxis protein
MEPSLAQLPLVLMTAGEPAPPEAARQLGISATLSKPVRPARLRACLAAVLLAT